MSLLKNLQPGGRNGLARDFAYHAVFLGFVISMIMAHAPVILPALTGLPTAWSRTFYVPLAALHATLALRVTADAALWLPARQWAGLLNAASILLFFATFGVTTLFAAAAARRARIAAAARVAGGKSEAPPGRQGEALPGPA